MNLQPLPMQPATISLKPILFLLLTPVIIAACVSSQKLTCSPGEQSVTLDSLYFGTATPGGIVTAEEWTTFLSETVVPDFPEGMTSWTTSGRWRTAAGEMQRETSYLLQLAHSGSQEKDMAIHSIIGAYKSRFQQEAVMRLRSPACRSF